MAEVIWERAGSSRSKPESTPRASASQSTGIARWRTEILGYYETMKEFNNMDPSEIFQNLSQFTARASEMRAMIAEHETRQEGAFRIKVIDPFIDECDRQFKVHSRALATEEMIAKLSGGRFT